MLLRRDNQAKKCNKPIREFLTVKTQTIQIIWTKSISCRQTRKLYLGVHYRKLKILSLEIVWSPQFTPKILK